MGDVDLAKARRNRMRAAVAAVVRGGGSGLRRVSGPALAGLLAGAAVVPAVATGVAVGPVLLAIVGVGGSVGANVLADLLTKVIDDLRTRNGRREPGYQPDDQLVAEAIAARVEAAFRGQGEHAEELRAEVAALLREVDAVGVALATAVETGDTAIQTGLASALGELSTQFDEFAFVVGDLRRGLWTVEETLRRQDAERRADRERARGQSVSLRLVLDKVTAVEARTRPTASGDGGAARHRWDGCPYLGLSPFEEHHADVFYGRSEMTARLMQRLAERLTGPGLLVVVGASGAGKSSLLRAGLVAQLATERLVPGSAAWPRRVLTPTGTPLQELAVHLADLAGGDAASMHRSLAEDPGRAPLLVRQALYAANRSMPIEVPRQPGPADRDNGQRHATSGGLPAGDRMPARLVLLVDQFEELFTLVDDNDPEAAAQRSAFVDALYAAAATPAEPAGAPPALVVLGIRADFLDRAMAYPQLREAIQAGPFAVGAMTEAELASAITGPAAEAGFTIEPGLVDTVLADLRGAATGAQPGAGALPLLSQAMLSTWEHRDGERLTVAAYRRCGGVADAVQTSAETAYGQLSAKQQQIVQAVFTYLTVVTSDGRFARRRVTRADLHAAAPARPDHVDAVVEAYAARRLIVVHRDAVEIAHDMLLVAWARLRDWLDRDPIDQAMHSSLIDNATDWRARHRDPSTHYTGARLAEVEEAAKRWTADPARYPPVPPHAREFLKASRRAANRATWRRRVSVAAMALLTIAAFAAAYIARSNATEADRQHALALSRQLATQSRAIAATEPVTARRLAAAAWHLAPTDEAGAILYTLLAEQRGTRVAATTTGEVTVVTYNRDSTHLATTSAVTAVVYSPDGTHLTTTSYDKTVRLGDPTTGHQTGPPLTGHTNAVTAVAYSPDGTHLTTTSDDGTVRLWDPTTGHQTGPPLTGHTSTVTAVAYSPDGTQLATTSWDKTVQLWDPILFGQPLVHLCQQLGPLTPDEWRRFAPGEPLPDVCPPR